MQYQKLLDGLVADCREILSDSLIGVYLHGSLAMGCFQPDASDIDVLVVTRGTPSDAQKRVLLDRIVVHNESAPPKGLEISVLDAQDCRPFRYPTPFSLHFSPTHLAWYRRDAADYVAKMHGDDCDLAAHVTVLNQYGVVLYGAPIAEVFGEVSREAYFDSIWGDIEGAQDDITEDGVYVALNLCRVLAFAREGLCLSKAHGATWALMHLPKRWHAIVTEAAQCYATGRALEWDAADAREFAGFMLREIAEGR